MKYNSNNLKLFIDLLSLHLMQNCSLHSSINILNSYYYVGTVAIYRKEGGLLLQADPTPSHVFAMQSYFSLCLCSLVEDIQSVRSFRYDL